MDEELALEIIDGDIELVDDEIQPWDRLEGEPTMWHERFLIYMQMGPTRTIQGAYKKYIGDERVARLKEEGKHPSANSQWYWEAKRYDWETRAAAWDDVHAREFIAHEEAIKQHARQTRIRAAVEGLGKAIDAIDKKTAEEVSKESMSALATTMRQFSDLLRQDLEGFTETKRVQVEMLIALLPPEVQEALSKKVRNG